MAERKLELDEGWTFLDVRGNPVEGRRLTFRLEDGTLVTVDVSHADYLDRDVIIAKLDAKAKAHEALKSL